MKFRWDKKYLFWGLTAFLVIAASMIFYDFMFSGNNIRAFLDNTFTILRPITYGLVIAYLLTPIVNGIEKSFFIPVCKKFGCELDSKVKKRIRAFAVFFTVILFIGCIYGLFSMILPQLVNSITSIAAQFPTYEKNLESFMNKILADNPQIESIINNMLSEYSVELNNWLNTKLVPQINIVIKEVSVSLIGIAKVLWNLLIGIIISVYVLFSKEVFSAQAKKIVYAFFEEEHGNSFIKDFRAINRTFGGYISAKLLDSLIIGLLCFIGMTLFQMPYTMLISVIVGVTNIIPFFGPYIGAIPSALLILMVDPIEALYFTIFILILQQFDGNFLGPKILGNSTGLSSFWVITSITLLGGYFGIIGMAIGVPVFAVIYAAVRRLVNRQLKRKGLSTNTREYMNLSEIVDNQYREMSPPKDPEHSGKLKVRKVHQMNDGTKSNCDDNHNEKNAEKKDDIGK